MKSTRLTILWLLGLYLFAACGSEDGGIRVPQSPAEAQATDKIIEPDGGETAVPILIDLDSVETLRERFNQDTGQVRLVLLLSPT